jgi:pimeloyl-ACP methyl ester carboxylesterase
MPIGPVSTTVLRFSGFMFPTARSKDVRRAVREFLTTPVDWYGHLAVAAAKHPRVSLSALEDLPTVFVAGRFDLMASHHDMRTASERVEGSEYVKLFGTHFLPLEKSKVIAELMREFADRYEA